MDLKKIKEKNPGFEFSAKATKKASKSVLENSLKPKLGIDSYNLKYADQVDSANDSITKKKHKSVNDKKGKFLKKFSTEQNKDFNEEGKGSMFDEQGNEIFAED